MTNPRMLEIVEMLLVGHGVAMDQFEDTMGLADEIMEKVEQGGSIADVRQIFAEGLAFYGYDKGCTHFNAVLLHGAAERLIVRH